MLSNRVRSCLLTAGFKKGFTLLELLASVAIVVVLAALLFPAATRGMESARSAKCLGNLRQLGVAASTYSSENDGRLVPTYVAGADLASSKVWRGLLLPYLGDNGKAFICPSDRFEARRTVNSQTLNLGTQPTSYGINMTYYYGVNGLTLPVPGFHDYGAEAPGRRAASVPHPASTVFICDLGAPDNVSSPVTEWTESNRRLTQASFGYASMPNRWRAEDFCIYPRHRGGRANVLFYDGHVRSVDIAAELVAHPIGDPQCLYDYH